MEDIHDVLWPRGWLGMLIISQQRNGILDRFSLIKKLGSFQGLCVDDHNYFNECSRQPSFWVLYFNNPVKKLIICIDKPLVTMVI